MELINILLLAFGLGLLHALDVDHLLAVSGLSGMRSQGMKHSLAFSVRWALGHGSSVLIVGSLVLFFGMAVPEKFSSIAERLIGFMLLGIGLMLLLDWSRKRSSLTMHRHDKMPLHLHIDTLKPVNPMHQHKHGTVLVGLLHGAAGSAPLLLLLPLTNMNSPMLGMAYLLLFSVGVLLSMMIFGGLLGNFFARLQKTNRQRVESLRLCLSIIMLSVSIYWLSGA